MLQFQRSAELSLTVLLQRARFSRVISCEVLVCRFSLTGFPIQGSNVFLISRTSTDAGIDLSFCANHGGMSMSCIQSCSLDCPKTAGTIACTHEPMRAQPVSTAISFLPRLKMDRLNLLSLDIAHCCSCFAFSATLSEAFLAVDLPL